MKRIRLDLAYHGAPYVGWQIQKNGESVEGVVEAALSKLYGTPIDISGAGRTDAGVHALAQVAHFDLHEDLVGPPVDRLEMAANALLPPTIRITSASSVEAEFHSRFSPHLKTYAYHFDLNRQAHPMQADRCYHVKYRPENHEAMEAFVHLLVGTHDFASFCSSANDTPTTVRTLTATDLVEEAPKHWVFRVTGKGFLHNMVRILAGTLLHVGRNRIEVETVSDILAGQPKKRLDLGPTLPAHGLWLESIAYLEREIWQDNDEGSP